MLNPLIERLVAENAALKAEVERLREADANAMLDWLEKALAIHIETHDPGRIGLPLYLSARLPIRDALRAAMAAEKAVETPIPKLTETDIVGL